MNIIEQAGASLLVLLFSLLIGILFQGVERKLFARFQNRIGPPVIQPLYDVLKLLSKETLVPKNSERALFVLAPLISLAAIATAVLFVPLAGISYWGFAGDTIVLLYVIALSSVGIILGASASGSPFAAVGASREITLLISYELPLVLVVLSSAFAAKTFSLGLMASNASLMLALGGIVFLACALGELKRAPFHLTEAETELAEGVYTEYSGGLLAAFKLAEAFRFYVFPMLFAALFVPVSGPDVESRLLLQLGAAFGAVVLFAVIGASSARLKIHQASGFYLKGVLALAVLQLAITVLL